MARVTTAPLAVLTQRDAIRVVALGLLGLIVPALAVLAGEGHSDPDVSAGHDGVLRESGFFKGKPRTGCEVGNEG
jgi:hypothetical protein